MLLFDVVGKVNVPPLQIADTCVNTGVVDEVTVTVIVAVVAHCPAAGVNVYVVVAVLLIAGLQVPVMLFVDTKGNINDSPLQMSATCVNEGVIGCDTVTVIEAEIGRAHV